MCTHWFHRKTRKRYHLFKNKKNSVLILLRSQCSNGNDLFFGWSLQENKTQATGSNPVGPQPKNRDCHLLKTAQLPSLHQSKYTGTSVNLSVSLSWIGRAKDFWDKWFKLLHVLDSQIALIAQCEKVVLFVFLKIYLCVLTFVNFTWKGTGYKAKPLGRKTLK